MPPSGFGDKSLLRLAGCLDTVHRPPKGRSAGQLKFTCISKKNACKYFTPSRTGVIATESSVSFSNRILCIGRHLGPNMATYVLKNLYLPEGARFPLQKVYCEPRSLAIENQVVM